jgi:cell division protein ZapA
MSIHSTVDISLQGREYRVTCAPEERDSLLAAVACVETRMNELAAKTKGTGERLAVMTALNLAHELLNKSAPGDFPAAPAETSEIGFDKDDLARRINFMVARLDAVMAQQDKLF